MRQVHFLHIGKCAGSYIKSLIRKINEQQQAVQIAAHPHRVILASLPPGTEYFFSVRLPEARFLSGFYSRKRKGQPRYYSEWSEQERLAFSSFEHANDLAEALFEDGAAGQQAFAAMKSIEHLAVGQSDYVRGFGFFLTARPPLAIIRQEQFDRDIALLYRRLGIVNPPLLAAEDVTAHRNDYANTPPLSDKAVAKLQRWYAQDHDFYRHCAHWIESGAER